MKPLFWMLISPMFHGFAHCVSWRFPTSTIATSRFFWTSRVAPSWWTSAVARRRALRPTPKRFAGGSSKSGISPVLFTPILWCVFSRKMLGGGDPGQHLGGNAGVPGTGGEKRMGDLSGEIMMVYGNRKWWFNGHLIGISWNVSGNLIFFHGKYKMMVSPSLKSLKWWFFMKGDNHEISWLVVFHGNFTGDLMAYIYRRMYIYI